jgi:hypothetical protein
VEVEPGLMANIKKSASLLGVRLFMFFMFESEDV